MEAVVTPTVWTQDEYMVWLDSLLPAQRAAVIEAAHHYFTPLQVINMMAMYSLVVIRDREIAELRTQREPAADGQR